MSRDKETHKKIPAVKKGQKTLSTKKLPSKKGKTISASSNQPIIIDVKEVNKNFQGVVDLAKRKFKGAPQEKMPIDIKPMLATSIEEPFNDAEWQFELKLDGYRALAYLNNAGSEKPKIDIRSRNNLSFNKKFLEIHQALQDWKINAVVDGEIVVLNEEGRPDFNSIQLWDKQKEGHLVFYVFDLLWLDGINVMDQPLHVRREVLMQIMPESGIIRLSDHIEDVGIDFYSIAKENNLEGIIAKRKDSLYLPSSRSRNWLKIKVEQRHEAIICGYTKNKDTDREFSSLILGIYEHHQLKFIGQVGTGFTATSQGEILKKMRPLVTQKAPFKEVPKLAVTTVWVKPFLVCEVKYTELTNEGVMRHPSFQGLREDKAAFELDLEIETATPKKVMHTEKIIEDIPEDLISPKKEEQLVTIDGHDLKLSNLKKLYWPKEKISKGEMLNYYYKISPYMMPYMKDRPQSLNRFPNGITGESFYHKNMGGKVDKWVKTFERVSESSGEGKDFLICTDTASLIYMANLGCIEMNPWHSRVQSPNFPDWTVIDLDPGDISFEKVIETAQMVHQVLKSLDIPSFPKTSGSTGIHIYIPLGAKYNYEQAKQLAELIANLVHEELPDFTSLVRNPRKRTDKIYIDYLQNRPIQTISAPYSVRPKPGATVSAPLHWDEVKSGLKMSHFTMKNILERVKSVGDLFDGVLGNGIDLNHVLKGLSNLI